MGSRREFDPTYLNMVMSRRALMRRAGAVASIAAISGSLGTLLTACGGEDDADATTPTSNTGAQSTPANGVGTQSSSASDDRTIALRGKEFTFVGWGGVYQEVQKKAFTDPFSEAYGVTVHHDGPMDNAKVRTMVETGNPTWDVCDITDGFLYNGSKDGLFEPINYDVVDRTRILPELAHEYGVGTIVWSYNIGYSTEAFPDDNHPRSWADVFNVDKFPGKRTLANGPTSSLEVALLADGVESKDLYPLDVDRAFAKLDTIKEHVIWWDTNSQSQQLFVDGEVVTGLILNGRAYDIIKQGAKVALEWNQNIQSVDYFVVLKGSQNVDVAMEFIDFASQPEGQALMANELAYAPTNPDAIPLIDEDVIPWLSTAPGNREKGHLINVEYWQENLQELTDRWNEWLLS